MTVCCESIIREAGPILSFRQFVPCTTHVSLGVNFESDVPMTVCKVKYHVKKEMLIPMHSHPGHILEGIVNLENVNLRERATAPRQFWGYVGWKRLVVGNPVIRDSHKRTATTLKFN